MILFINFNVGLILNSRNLNWYNRVEPLPPILAQLLSFNANIMSDCGVISYGKKLKKGKKPKQYPLFHANHQVLLPNRVTKKILLFIKKLESSPRWKLQEDTPWFANKFFQTYIPKKHLEKDVTKYNPAPTNIGRSKRDSYLAATSV